MSPLPALAHRLLVEIVPEAGGGSVHSEPLSPGALELALDGVLFLGMRRGQVEPVFDVGDPVRIVPDGVALPIVDSFRLEIVGCDLDDEIPVESLRPHADRVVQRLRRAGSIGEKDRCGFRVIALPVDGELDLHSHRGRGEPGFATEPWRAPVREGSLEHVLGGARASVGIDHPVVISADVLEEVQRLKHAAGDCEAGGVLIGHLRRDRKLGEIFVEVTALLPARHAVANSRSLKFTERTWSAVDDAIALRAQNELIVGWAHSHPARHWCAKCSPASRSECGFTRPFFSADDRLLHETIFPRPFTVGLLAGDRFDAASDRWIDFHALFGWRRGVLVERSFHVIRSDVTNVAREGVDTDAP